MKKIFFSIVFLFSCSFFASAQGIKFVAGTLQQAQAAARAANKPLFVEVYLNGCPHCAALAPYLNEKAVGDLYNAQFVSYKVEANSNDSKMLQQSKGLTYPEFPLFFFFDVGGKLIHQANPSEKTNKAEFIAEINKHGKAAMNPKERSTNYDARYAAGDREVNFLVNYAKYCKTLKNADRLLEINDIFGNSFKKPSELEGKEIFYLIKNIINDANNPIGKYFIKNLSKYKSKYPANEVKEAVESLVYNSLYGKRADKYTYEQVVSLRTAMTQVGVAPKEAEARTLLKEIEVCLKQNQTAKGTARINAYIMSHGMNSAEYAYFTRYFNDTAKDVSYVPALVQWVNAAAPKAKPTEKKELGEMYNELARAYKRVNNKAEADKATKKAAAYL